MQSPFPIINAARAGVSTLGGDLYMYGVKVWDGAHEVLDAMPCFICKKMILNAGIKRIISNTKDGKISIIEVKDLVEDWQENDLISANTTMSTDKYGKK